MVGLKGLEVSQSALYQVEAEEGDPFVCEGCWGVFHKAIVEANTTKYLESGVVDYEVHMICPNCCAVILLTHRASGCGAALVSQLVSGDPTLEMKYAITDWVDKKVRVNRRLPFDGDRK